MPAADGAFISLAQVLRGDAVTAEVAPPEVAPVPVVPEPAPLQELAELARDVRLFRARLSDAFTNACDALLREFAYGVLGRELILAPPEIAAIAARVLAARTHAQPLRLRVAPSDVAALARYDGALPAVTADAELAAGDAVFELHDGQIDARLGVRLAVVLADLE